MNFRRLSIFFSFSSNVRSTHEEQKGLQKGNRCFCSFHNSRVGWIWKNYNSMQDRTTPRISGSFLFFKTPLLQRVGVLWFPSVTLLEVGQSCRLLFYRQQAQPTAIYTYKALLIRTEAFFSTAHAWWTQVSVIGLLPVWCPQVSLVSLPPAWYPQSSLVSLLPALVYSPHLPLFWVSEAFPASHQPSPNTF